MTRGQGESALIHDESVASFARRRLGREAYERLVQPLVAGIYTADPEQLSVAATMPQFLEYERQHGSLLRATLRMPWSRTNRTLRTGHFSDQLTPDQSPATSSPNTNPERDPTHDASGARYSLFAALRKGMTSLVNALAARLPPGTIHLNTPVTSITRESDNRWRLNLPLPRGEGRGDGHPGEGRQDNLPLPLGEGRGEGELFDALIIATPAHAAAKLLDTCDPELAAELAAIPYAGCAVVSFGFAPCKSATS